MRVCQALEAKYGKPTELVIIQWSVAEALIQEQVDIFTNGLWNFNSVDDQQRLDELQTFKSGFRTGLYEAGYVGILDNRIPVVASIHAHTCALATVAPAPNQVEIGDEHNTIYIRWA